MADDVLSEQIAYYRARAPEYDSWFERRGSFSQGPEWDRRWEEEVAQVAEALDAVVPTGRVLELACGTGWWTQRLVRHADELTCLDASPETIERARVRAPAARFVVADLFEWEPDQAYDVVFFSFWLSHVPPNRFDAFWGLVERALAPGGRVFFIDGLGTSDPERQRFRAARQRATEQEGVVVRKLEDAREFRIVKVYHEPEALQDRLTRMGWDIEVRATAEYLHHGSGRRG